MFNKEEARVRPFYHACHDYLFEMAMFFASFKGAKKGWFKSTTFFDFFKIFLLRKINALSKIT